MKWNLSGSKWLLVAVLVLARRKQFETVVVPSATRCPKIVQNQILQRTA